MRELHRRDAPLRSGGPQAGDVAKAKALFAAARAHYETIEPVAESFGDLDPKIDAREDDVADRRPWTGFHRIEQVALAARHHRRH